MADDKSKVVYTDDEIPTTGSRIGYVITIVINGLLLWVVFNLVEGGWLPFITPEFDEAVPAIAASLLATMVMSTVYLFTRSEPVRVIGEFFLAVVGFWATLQLYVTWPFDFSIYPNVDWDFIVRLLLGLAVFGTGVAVLANLVRLLRIGRR